MPSPKERTWKEIVDVQPLIDNFTNALLERHNREEECREILSEAHKEWERQKRWNEWNYWWNLQREKFEIQHPFLYFVTVFLMAIGGVLFFVWIMVYPVMGNLLIKR